MRWLSGILLIVTMAVTAGLGFSPTTFELSNSLGAVECRSVLAPMIGQGFMSQDEVSRDVVEEWLLEVGYDDNGVIPGDYIDAAELQAEDLCAEARAGRTGAMILASVLGFGVSGVASLLARPRSRAEQGS